MTDTGERPLTGGARTRVLAGATAIILVFYASLALAVVVNGVFVGTLGVLLLGAARIGLVGAVTQMLVAPIAVLRELVRSVWLRSGPELRIALRRDEAPALFDKVRQVAEKMGVEAPREIVLEMTGGAWVNLGGFRRGAGRTKLGIGYDLLAALSEKEVDAVLAHEMAHAKFVSRGLSRWLRNGLRRAGQLARALSMEAANARQRNKPSWLANTLAKFFDSLAWRAARYVATYSRQDEFEADRGAARVYGAAHLRSALTKLDALDSVLSRLPWAERLSRIHPGESFSEWLIGEIANPPAESGGELPFSAVDPYSTHPSLRDRLTALPPGVPVTVNARPAIDLLADPDREARRLLTEIQRVIADAERRDSKELARATRARSKRRHRDVEQLMSLGLMAVGGLLILIIVTSDWRPDQLLLGIVILAGGIFMYRAVRHHDKLKLPVPRYGTMTNPFKGTREELIAAEKRTVAELEAKIASVRGTSPRGKALVKESYAALEARDYLRAHVAARLALAIDNKNVEAAMGYAVAAGGLGNAEQVQRQVLWIAQAAGLNTINTKWAAAWALSMIDDWSCEGFLEQLQKMDPTEATFPSLLALAQLQRGKAQMAAQNLKRSCALEPGNTAHAQMLAVVLVQLGRPAEARERLEPLEEKARTDAPLACTMVQVSLMLRDTPAANAWAATLRAAHSEPKWLIALGNLFESSRLLDRAEQFYHDVLDTECGREAHIGLARIDIVRGNSVSARGHLLSALVFENITYAGASPQVRQMFHETLAHLMVLERKREACTSWFVTLTPDRTHPLSGNKLAVYATTLAGAQAHLQIVADAMNPGGPPLPVAKYYWNEAPKDQQPLRPVYAGVQGVAN